MYKNTFSSHKGDPSSLQQHFPSYDLQLLCCRFWQLKNWEFKDLSFPYWRVYYNFKEGAFIRWNDQSIALSTDKIFLISPNTPYSSYIWGNSIPKKGFKLDGSRITSRQIKTDCIPHFFIHFNLGIPYDNITPGIIAVSITAPLREKIRTICDHLIENAADFSFTLNLTIRALLNELLCNIPQERWQSLTHDHRIFKILNYIDKHLEKDLSNQALAKELDLATNSFTRLFTKEVEISPQRYIKQKRIDRACILLHHSQKSIEEIAEMTGFSDRYHFSRIFKQITQTSPAMYRKLS